MYKQVEVLRRGATFVRNSTYQIDLPKSGFLSALYLEISADCVSGATLADPKWRLFDHLGTVEVIGNGATVIKSANFVNMHFWNWLRQGIVPPHFWRNYATNTQFEHLLIPFGRFFGDPIFGLDLSKWDSVELKVTNSATSAYYGADLSISVFETWLRDHPAGFAGYLRDELWREWKTVQNETKYLELPVEYPIADILLRAMPATTAGASATGYANLMYDIDFSVEGGTKQVYKGRLGELGVLNHLERGAEVLTGGHFDVTADNAIDIGIGRVFGWAGISGSKDGAVSIVIPTVEADSTSNTLKPEAREADSPVHFLFRGYGYQNHAWLWHSPNLLEEELLNPAQYSDIRLNIQTRDAASAASGTNQVLLSRVVPR